MTISAICIPCSLSSARTPHDYDGAARANSSDSAVRVSALPRHLRRFSERRHRQGVDRQRRQQVGYDSVHIARVSSHRWLPSGLRHAKRFPSECTVGLIETKIREESATLPNAAMGSVLGHAGCSSISAGRAGSRSSDLRAPSQCPSSRVLPRAAFPAAHRQATSLPQPVGHALVEIANGAESS